MNIATIYNPDNLPVKKVLMYGTRAIVLPKGAVVIFDSNWAIPHIEIDGELYKYCGACHRWKRLYEFYKDRGRTDKLCPWCADCKLESRRRRYLKKKYGKFI